NSGTLQVDSGGSTGTLGAGDVTNNGILTFNRAGTFTFNNNISGGGELRQIAAAGTLVLGGNNTYFGPTTINATAALRLDGTGTLGTASIVNNGILIFNRSTALTVANVISGTGAVQQTGITPLTL